MSEVKRYRFNGAAGEYVYANDYDAVQSELAAMREEVERQNDIAHAAQIKCNKLEYRLTAAEQRNDSLLEAAQGLTIQLHATIGNTEHHEDCIRDLAALQPTESGASE